MLEKLSLVLPLIVEDGIWRLADEGGNVSKQIAPKELQAITQQQDERKLDSLRAEMQRTTSAAARRSIELAIEETTARIDRRNTPAMLAYIDERQAEFLRRQNGDPAENATREASIDAQREMRQSDSFRRKINEYAFTF